MRIHIQPLIEIISKVRLLDHPYIVDAHLYFCRRPHFWIQLVNLPILHCRYLILQNKQLRKPNGKSFENLVESVNQAIEHRNSYHKKEIERSQRKTSFPQERIVG